MKKTPEMWVNTLGMKFRLIRPGTFEMGSPKTESRRFADETRHVVTISSPFFLSLYLTTQAEWRAVMGENPSKFTESKKLPVESVSWIDCATFLEKINSEEYGLELSSFLGKQWRYAFPTEAQWEYACRAGSDTAYYWGDDASEKKGNFGKTSLNRSAESDSRFNVNRTTSEIGSYPPNSEGFFDMSGNVCEWVADFYADYDLDKKVDPRGPSLGIEHVARGILA